MNKEDFKQHLIDVYQALLTINVKGADVITLSNTLSYVSNLIRESDNLTTEKETDKTEKSKTKDAK